MAIGGGGVLSGSCVDTVILFEFSLLRIVLIQVTVNSVGSVIVTVLPVPDEAAGSISLKAPVTSPLTSMSGHSV